MIRRDIHKMKQDISFNRCEVCKTKSVENSLQADHDKLRSLISYSNEALSKTMEKILPAASEAIQKEVLTKVETFVTPYLDDLHEYYTVYPKSVDAKKKLLAEMLKTKEKEVQAREKEREEDSGSETGPFCQRADHVSKKRVVGF